MRTVDFVNLASGLAWLEDADGPVDFGLIRIQSTACEQKRWSFLLEDLDYGFMVHAARGNTCRVWDASAHKLESRAIYQGLPWIRYAMERRWLGVPTRPRVKGWYVDSYFDQCYRQLSERAAKKLDYAGKFLTTRDIRIEGRCKRTTLDGKYAELSGLLAA